MTPICYLPNWAIGIRWFVFTDGLHQALRSWGSVPSASLSQAHAEQAKRAARASEGRYDGRGSIPDGYRAADRSRLYGRRGAVYRVHQSDWPRPELLYTAPQSHTASPLPKPRRRARRSPCLGTNTDRIPRSTRAERGLFSSPPSDSGVQFVLCLTWINHQQQTRAENKARRECPVTPTAVERKPTMTAAVPAGAMAGSQYHTMAA